MKPLHLALAVGLLLILTALGLAQEQAHEGPTNAQWLKLLGYMPEVKLEDAEGTAVKQAAVRQAGLDERLCMFPDHPDQMVANADAEELSEEFNLPLQDCQGIIRAHKSWLEATGHGSFPHSCDPDHPGVHVVKMYRDVDSYLPHMKRQLSDEELEGIIKAKVWGPTGDPRGPPFTMEELKEAWGDAPLWKVVDDFTAETYRRLGVLIKTVPVHQSTDNIHVLSRRIAGSTIGIGWFPDGRDCPGDHVEFHIDSSYTAGFQGQVGLDVHECGHTLQAPHQFSGQNRHQEPMSYRYSNHLFVGYVTDDMTDITGLPVSPSVSLFTRLYGGEPVGVPWRGKFEGDTDPDPDPPTGDFPFEVGDTFEWILQQHRLTLEVTNIEVDEGQTLADQVAAAYAEIEKYSRRDSHRSSLASLYASMAVVVEGGTSVEDAHATLEVIRQFLLGSKAKDWSEVFELADSATTPEGFRSVAQGLGVRDKVDLDGSAMLDIAQRAQAFGEIEISPIMLEIIEQVIDMIGEDRPFLKVILQILLSVLQSAQAEQVEKAEPAANDGAYWGRRPSFPVSASLSPLAMAV